MISKKSKIFRKFGNPSQIKAVVFDMDGVLLDSYYVWVKTVDSTAKELGFDGIDEKKFRKLFGQSTSKDIEVFMPGKTPEEVEEAYAKYFPQFVGEMTLIDNAFDVLKELKSRGIKIAVATNTVTSLAKSILEKMKLKQFIDVVVGGDQVENAKPDPAILLKALEKLKVKADEALYVGDTIYDVGTGKNAKVITLGYKIDADYKINDLKEVLEKC